MATGRCFEDGDVTPEMIEAGEECIYQHHIIEGGAASRSEIQDCVKDIFLTMVALTPSKLMQPSR